MIMDAKFRMRGLVVLVATIACVSAQTTTTQTAIVDPCIGQPDGFIRHPTDCTKYFSCYGGVGYENTCPDGKYFDDENMWCDLSSKVSCVVNTCPPEGIVFQPIPGVCDRYIICVGGSAFEEACDVGLYFDPVNLECNLKEVSNCVVNPCTQPPPNPPILEIHPNDLNCTTYIICANGEPIVRNCAPGLFFDPNDLQCTVATECIPLTGGATTVDPNAPTTTVDPLATTTVDPLATTTVDPLATTTVDPLVTTTEDPLLTTTEDPLATTVV